LRSIRLGRGGLSTGLAAFAIAAVCFAPQLADAQDKPACEQFNWSVKRELALFRDPNLETVFSGATLDSPPEKGIVLELQPHGTVDYVMPPGRPPKSEDSLGGFLLIANVGKAGSYQVTASDDAWIDIIQKGNALSSEAHTGSSGCNGVRKSLRFNLEPGPLTVQVSGAGSNLIKLAILPAE
jgi:hypothetical protein